MGRIRNASERFSSARRYLIESYIEGERSLLLAAMRDVSAGLKALERVPLTSSAARASLETLRTMMPTVRSEEAFAEVLERMDRIRFAGAVDELASWLYFSTERAH